jgi:hypothetical protein
MGPGSAEGIFFIIMFILFFAIGVALSRWIFRVNDIVERLDQIVELLKNQKGTPS